MIVKCEKCQTRFKIPDEKVTEKGVKVRCTKCQNTFRVTKSGGAASAAAVAAVAAPPPPPPAPAIDPDPFAKFGHASALPPLETTRPHQFPEGIAATRHPLAPSFSAQADLPPEAFDSPTRVGPVPRAIMQALEASDAPPPAPSGFDPSNPFGAASSPPPPEPPPPAPPLESAPPPAPPEDDLFGKANTSVGPQPLPFGDPQQLPEQVPPPESGAGTDDLFGNTDSSLTSQPLPLLGNDAPPAGSDEPDRGLFEMPEAPPASAESVSALGGALDDLPAEPPPASTPVARIALVSSAVERPAGRPEDVGMGEERGPGAVRRTAGLVVNLALATALVLILLSVGTIYLNEGKVDVTALSLEPVKALFAAPSEFVAADVSNGLYDTRGAKQVFYVRGDAENHSTHAARLAVRVEILDGKTSIAKAQTLAGKAPTPEALYAVTSDKELAALVESLNQAAVEVKPGERVPFVVAFYEYPPALSEYRLKVTVEEAPGATAAR